MQRPRWCREQGVSETLDYGWREKLLVGGKAALGGREERGEDRELRREVAELERALGRKRVLRVLREQGLIQRSRSLPRRKRPGFFQVERPGQLWHVDMTSI